jgi:peptidoglycan/xylan/chitin deacetylase (PgdA/CDA1 family)
VSEDRRLRARAPAPSHGQALQAPAPGPLLGRAREVADPLKAPRRDGRGRSALALLLGALLVGTLLLGGCADAGLHRTLLARWQAAPDAALWYVPDAPCAVALTLDDGPLATTTPAILDLLAEHESTATFFLLGNGVPGNEALVRRMVAEGHELGHHMARDFPTILLTERAFVAGFDLTAARLEALGTVPWFRPGWGFYEETIATRARARGYRIALASLPPLDTVVPFPSLVAAALGSWARPGSVLVLHDGLGRGEGAHAILERLLPRLQARGLAVKSLGGLVAAAQDPGQDACAWDR